MIKELTTQDAQWVHGGNGELAMLGVLVIFGAVTGGILGGSCEKPGSWVPFSLMGAAIGAVVWLCRCPEHALVQQTSNLVSQV